MKKKAMKALILELSDQLEKVTEAHLDLLMKNLDVALERQTKTLETDNRSPLASLQDYL